MCSFSNRPIHLHHLLRHDPRRVFRLDEPSPVAPHRLQLPVGEREEPPQRGDERCRAYLYPRPGGRRVQVLPRRAHGGDDRRARGERFRYGEAEVLRVRKNLAIYEIWLFAFA